MDKSNLYGWIFHFNHFANVWSAAKREHYNELFSSRSSSNILSSSRIETLVEIISRTNGESAKIKKLLKNEVKHVIVE